MKKTRSALHILFTALIVLILCLGIILAGWLVISLPQIALKQFGPPSPYLSDTQRIYLSARLWLESEALTRAQMSQEPAKLFKIRLGESTYDISERLQAEGLIINSRAFRDFLVYSGLDTTLQAGEYMLNPRMNSIELAHALQDATPQQITFRILPGWRIEEIAASLPTSGLNIAPDAFLAAARVPAINHPVIESLPTGASLEGFLFPDSYSLDRELLLDQFIQTILDDFQIKINLSLQEGFRKQGLNMYQAVTLASIVQRESVVEEEMPMIASVFLNRLAAGMKLESDPTVQYALGFQDTSNTWWKNPLMLVDLTIDSPYNTYSAPGLPPGPIANPGLSALQAVAFPAETTYFYFRAACDGSGLHAFSQTFEEHKSLACP